jgi:SAM-dependent methyltransferase
MDRASAARIYDYWLNGSHNFAVDREAGDRVSAQMPHAPAVARANRAFMNRAVRWLVGQGIRQFLDIGSGIPTVGNVHEVAQRIAPKSRVVYVDIDPVAVAHAQQILGGDARAVSIEEDLRRPDDLLDRSELHAVLDMRQPVGLLLVSVLHFVPDAEDPYGAVARLRDALVPGSYLALSHGALEGFDPAAMDTVKEVYQKTTNPSGQARTREEIRQFFGDFELVEPGLVWLSQWRPDLLGDEDLNEEQARKSAFLAGVARKAA